MAANRRVLEEILRQKTSIGTVVDARTARLAKKWARAWDEMQGELDRAIQRILAGNATVTAQVAAIKAMQAQQVAVDALNRLARQAGSGISDDVLQLINAAPADALKLIGLQFPLEAHSRLGVDLLRTDARQIAEIVQRTTEQITARTYMLSLEATAAMERELIHAVAIGSGPREAARLMLAGVEGAFLGGLTRAMVIARTETLDAYRRAAQEEEAKHRDVLTGWQWITELTARTCRSCVAMHGTLHPLDEPGPLDHHQGRCARLPVTKTWKQLGIDAPEPPAIARPGDGEKWLSRQPRGVQDKILGERGAEAWRNGQWPAEKWAERRSTAGWRDSYHPAKQPDLLRS